MHRTCLSCVNFSTFSESNVLVDRMTTTLIIDRFNIIYEIHIMFNSHQFNLYLVSRALRHSCFASLISASGHLVDHNCFPSPCSLSIVLAYMRSFFCHEIYQTLRLHHTTIICTLSVYSSFYTNIMYIHSTIYSYLWQPLPQKCTSSYHSISCCGK